MTGPRSRARKPHAGGRDVSTLERIFGKHAVRAVILARPRAVRRLVIARGEDFHEDIAALATGEGIKVEFLEWPEFLRAGAFSRDQRHQGIFLLAEPRGMLTEKDFHCLEGVRVVLALDQISDPQNLATMVRCAAFFGVDAIFILRDRSVDVSPEVARQAVGGIEFVKIFRVTNLSQSLDALKDFGFFVVGLDERGTLTFAETSFPERLALVVGAEGAGLRPKTKKYCDALVRIPGGRQGVESLNAGVAAAIAMAEIFRGPPRGARA